MSLAGLELPPVAWVFLYGLVTALATGLGALPFAFVRRISPAVVAYTNAVAAGLMLGASFGLLVEGTRAGAFETVGGVLLGVLFIWGTQRLLGEHDFHLGSVGGGASGVDARRMILMVVVMTVHSFSEGVAVGASFAGDLRLATVITAAIAVHNIPEGLAISAVLRPRGAGLVACAGWSIVSSLPQPVMAVPAFLFVEAFRPALPWGIGFAAGAMVFMVFVELLPEAYERSDAVREGGAAERLPGPGIGAVASLTLIAMLLFQRLL